MHHLQKAILKTIVYSDIFDYPLSEDEIWKYLISQKTVGSYDKFKKTLNNLGLLSYNGEYYCIKGREGIFSLRQERKKASKEKLSYAKSIAKKLFSFPTVLFIGISGSLSLENADTDEDIDFFIITAAHTVWITRLMLLLYLQYKGLRRKRNEINVKNKICLNMFIDTTHLFFSKDKQNIYIAHEIVQIRPLYQRSNTYNLFTSQNSWIQKFLPHTPVQSVESKKSLLPVFIFSLFEPFARIIQTAYMKNHKTREITSKFFIGLHPIDRKFTILRDFQERCRQYGI